MNRTASFALRIALAAVAAVALFRGLALVTHTPLLAYANNYDQVRELACLDLGPWRPDTANADAANPTAPFSRFSFRPLPREACVWTSDLAFTAPVALAWRAAEALGGRPVHSVRRLAEFRLLLWYAVALWATLAFLRAERIELAIAHLAWLAAIGMDPANTLFLATYYSEAAAIFGAYLCVVGAAVALVRPTTASLAITAFGGFVLAGSKFQHLVLPIVLGICVFVAGGRAARRTAFALVAGGVLGCALQIGNQTRDAWMVRDMAMINRMDYVLTVLLENTSDIDRVAKAMNLDAECLSHKGQNVYEINMPSEKACPNHQEWRKATMWWLLISDPPALAKAVARVPALLLPWQPPNLGVVEGETNGRLPPTSPSFDALLGDGMPIGTTILIVPWLIFIVCCVRRCSGEARAMALVGAAGSGGVAMVALLGDGTVEYAKHAHLAVSFAFASLCVPLAAGLMRWRRPELTPVTQ